MHKEILTETQNELLPVVKNFRGKFTLVGGTAIALHIGHRESLDFDLFSRQPFRNYEIKNKVADLAKIESVQIDRRGEFTFTIKGVKFTFFHYQYEIAPTESFEDVIRIPNLLTLAAMKAFALGRRAKWKDYIDLYFIMKDHHSLFEINQTSFEIFGGEFNEKFFRTQLVYFNDIDYTEKIIYKPGFETTDELIKKFLVEMSLGA